MTDLMHCCITDTFAPAVKYPAGRITPVKRSNVGYPAGVREKKTGRCKNASHSSVFRVGIKNGLAGSDIQRKRAESFAYQFPGQLLVSIRYISRSCVNRTNAAVIPVRAGNIFSVEVEQHTTIAARKALQVG